MRASSERVFVRGRLARLSGASGPSRQTARFLSDGRWHKHTGNVLIRSKKDNVARGAAAGDAVFVHAGETVEHPPSFTPTTNDGDCGGGGGGGDD